MEGTVSINLMGGLGNQIFQMIIGYSLCKKYNKQLIIKSKLNNPHSTLNYFQSIFRKLNIVSIIISNRYIFNEPDNGALTYYDIPNQKNIELIGYFQNEKYFSQYRNEIVNLLQMEDERKNKLQQQYTTLDNAYFIHIRRGDYVGNSLHDINLEMYYQKCIEWIKTTDNNIIFYIFSNDIEYCKSISWLKNENVLFINLDELDSLYLMSMCKGGIGCNSSYSWWAGYLNEHLNKKIIYPNKWFNNNWSVDIAWKGCYIMDIINYNIDLT